MSRPFSGCLAGSFGGGLEHEMTDVGPDGATVLDYRPYISISADGSVQQRPRFWVEYLPWQDYSEDRSYKLVDAAEERNRASETSTFVKSVRRSADRWRVRLRPSSDPRIEVIFPPFCVLELANGESVDLCQQWEYHGSPVHIPSGLSQRSEAGRSALLTAARITYNGHVKRKEGAECIVSFPGKYADGWYTITATGDHDTGVACVFLCDERNGFGKHAVDPDANVPDQCYCRRLYGHRDYRIL